MDDGVTALFFSSTALSLSHTSSPAYPSSRNWPRYQEENEWIKSEQIIKKNPSIFLDCMCETMLTLYCFCSVQELLVGVEKTEVGIDFSSGVGVAGWKHRGLFHFIMKLLVCSLSEREAENEKDWGQATCCELQHNSGLQCQYTVNRLYQRLSCWCFLISAHEIFHLILYIELHSSWWLRGLRNRFTWRKSSV